MSLTTLNDIFFAAAERNLDRAMLYRDAGKWLPISSSDFRRNVAATVGALQEWGIKKGDRVAILSENRPEWSTPTSPFCCSAPSPFPSTRRFTPEQTAYTLSDSGASVIFVSTEHQLRKVQTILSQTQVKKSWSWIIFRSRATLPPLACSWIIHDPRARSPSIPKPNPVPARSSPTTSPPSSTPPVRPAPPRAQCSPTATWRPTSPARCSASTCAPAGQRFVPSAFACHRAPRGSRAALPRRHAGVLPLHGESPANSAGSAAQSLRFCSQGLRKDLRQNSRQQHTAFPSAPSTAGRLSVGRAHKPEILAGETPTSSSWKLANKLVFSKIRAGMGGKVETFISEARPWAANLPNGSPPSASASTKAMV
jgi:long-chain acyl-CoA synthetase